MSDQALYRKYRSSSFDEVLGQEHVVKTLTTAISHGRFSHAYLFTGPRGVGKTSVARLLARSLNCTGDTKPCNQCPNCLAAINSSLDVVEIDAASNRSIDSVRDLRDKVALAPTQGRYKIYIIDEVHMLTNEAFNALLKTLEEPPAHAVFVLATTEAHKVPDTIISRTQRFSFKPITLSDITSHLAKIASAENIEIEAAALDVIATASRGGFRDAISMLDQLAASGAKPVTAATVRSLLGYSSAEEIEALAQAIAASDAQSALAVIARLEAGGAQPGQVAIQLTELWRRVLLAGSGALQSPEPAVTKLTSAVPPARAAAIVQELLEVTRSHWPQLALEASVVKLTAPAAPSPAATPAPAPVASTAPAPAKPAPKAAAEPAPAATTGILESGLWPKVLVIMKSQNNNLCALLQMYPVDFGDGEVTIKPKFNFHRDLLLKPVNRTMVEAAASKVYGRPVRVLARTEETGAPKKRQTKPDPSAELVSSALEILGGEIVE
ncbi:MAG: polymerase-3 subunit gamma/tau [Candidatus Saccharibacteria bacterium]|nr:polymerase-3 subunit gamma/tau [Candidatus Saccharibacteria bacterium]